MGNCSKNSLLSFSNESLEAMLKGLSFQADDRVISICSCGAQPLAFLEYLTNGTILAIDYKLKQIQFAKEVVSLVQNLDIKSLRKMDIAPKDRNYFADKNRLKAITNNLGRLRFKFLDVTKEPKLKQRFTKGYFSNAPVNLNYFHPLFEKGALVYTAFATANLPGNIDKFLDNRSEAYGCDIRELYDVDKERTELACKIEALVQKAYHHSVDGGYFDISWTPCVFVKK